MVTGLDIVQKGIWTIDTYHPRYYNKSESRCHPDLWPHVADCSGLWCFVLAQLGLSHGCTNSAYFAQIGHQFNLGVTKEYALTNPGCFLIRGPNEGQDGYGNLGHIGVSVGDGKRDANGALSFWGHSIEARGTYSGVHYDFEADDIWWSYFMKIPGVHYETVAPTPPVIKPKPKPKEAFEMYWLPLQENDNMRPIGVQVVGGLIKVYNVSKNPFKEGLLVATENAHKLILPLAEGEEVLGLTRFNPHGELCPPAAPIEICTNLPSAPDTRGQPRHILHRV